MINDNIEITIVEAKNGVCKVAIQADKDVKIYREEIYLQIKLANMIGKNTNVTSVDSVSAMIKQGTDLNKQIDKSNIVEDEIIVEDKPTMNKSIRVNKKNS